MSNWIFSCTPENWEISKKRGLWAVRTATIRNKIKGGDHVVFYVTRSNPPSFLGIYKVVGNWRRTKEPVWDDEVREGRIIYPWQSDIEPIQLGTVNYKELSKKLSFVENKEVWYVYMMGAPSNFGRPISEEDYQLIHTEMKKTPISVTFRAAVKPPRPKLLEKEVKPPVIEVGKIPKHNDIRDMIKEIGELKGKVAETEYPLDDLQLDVIWRERKRQVPDRVWEVHIAGNFYEAIAKLKHAWDIWGSEPFLVTTEEYMAEAKTLLGGTFHEIEEKVRIINYKKIVELQRLLHQAANVEKEIRL